jgi:hypothetical protein
MNLRNTFILFLLLMCFGVHAQRIELMLTTGMADYSMKDLKKMNTYVQESLQFDTQVTDNFPMTIQVGGHFALVFSNNYKLGILYAYNSTGSRVTASDYSGYYQFDNIVTGHTVGIMNGFLVYGYKAIRLDFQANAGFIASDLKMSETLTVADTTISSAPHYTAIGFYAEPRVELSCHWKNLKGGFYLGYCINPGGKIRNGSGQKSNYTINWSGLRFGIEIGLHQAE